MACGPHRLLSLIFNKLRINFFLDLIGFFSKRPYGLMWFSLLLIFVNFPNIYVYSITCESKLSFNKHNLKIMTQQSICWLKWWEIFVSCNRLVNVLIYRFLTLFYLRKCSKILLCWNKISENWTYSTGYMK